MGAMPWLVAMKLDRTRKASIKPKPWAPRRAHTSVWGRRTDAPDAWLAGWCTLLGSEGLDQRHADGHPVTKGALRGRGQLVRGTL